MTETIVRLQLPEDYRQAGRAHLFPSPESLAWFIRRNRSELIEAGALLRPNGPWMVSPEAFDGVVLTVGARRAAASAA